MKWDLRTGLLTVVLGVLVLLPSVGSVRAQDDATAIPASGAVQGPLSFEVELALAARLGGSRESFDERFGPARLASVSTLYDLPDGGLLQIQFSRFLQTRVGMPAPEPDDRALQIILRSHRAADTPATTPDPADWTTTEVRELISRFLPPDVVLGEETELAAAVTAIPCHSELLSQAFTVAAGAGSCQINLLAPTPDTVSFITLSVSRGDEIASSEIPGDECIGIAGWLRITQGQLGSAGVLLAEVERIDDGDPEAIARLQDLATQFSIMSTEVRSRPAPVIATEASNLLADTFNAYAEAFKLAAAGVRGANDDALRQAIGRIEQARADYTLAGDLVADAAADCGLDSAAGAPD